MFTIGAAMAEYDAHLVTENPTAVFAVLNGGKEKVHIRSYPTIERVAVLAELFRLRIFENVCVCEPSKQLATPPLI